MCAPWVLDIILNSTEEKKKDVTGTHLGDKVDGMALEQIWKLRKGGATHKAAGGLGEETTPLPSLQEWLHLF